MRYVLLISRWVNRMFKFWVMLVLDHRGPIARGLEQSPALRVLDAPALRGSVVAPRRGHLQQVTPQFTSRWMVSGVEIFIFVDHRNQSPLRRTVLRPAFGDDFHHLVVVMGRFRCFPRYPAICGLDHLRITDHKSSDTGDLRSSHNALGAFQGLVLICRFTLRTVIHGIRLPGPIVGRGGKPFDSPSTLPCLAHPWPSA